MAKKKKFYLIEDVATTLGVSISTVRNWEREGKIPRAKRDKISNYRLYTEKDITALQKRTGRVT